MGRRRAAKTVNQRIAFDVAAHGQRPVQRGVLVG